jgi:hypothetical protein
MNFIHNDLNKHFDALQFQRVDSLEWNDGELHTVYLKDICFQSHY